MNGVLFFLLAGLPSVHADIDFKETQAVLYEAETNRKNPLYRFARVITALPNSVVRSETRFTDMEGTLTFFERADSKKGKIIRYEWNHPQMGESGLVEMKGGKAYYTLMKGEKIQSETGDAPENFVIGPTIISYAQSHWEDLMNGSSVAVRIGVPDRLNDYGFRFTRDKTQAAEKSGVVHVSLRPTSVFISIAVKPIDFIFSNDGTHLLSTKGMSLLKVKRNGKWEDLIAETVFE